MYVTIKRFIDLEDNGHVYSPGDIYPREGLTVSKNRIIELATSLNKLETPIITFIEDETVNKKTTIKKTNREIK